MTLRNAVCDWLAGIESKPGLDACGAIGDALVELKRITELATPRQRLLYLHTRTPSIGSAIIGMAQHEPVAEGRDTLRTRSEWPYGSVHDAILDGWQVIHFPELRTPYDDREMEFVGYEFILQKQEEVVDA